VATMPLTPAEISSWYCVAFLTSGGATLLLSLRYRQPLAIGFTLPGLVLLSSASAGHSLAELMGASIVAGVVVVALAACGAVERLMRWLPLPLVLGMFVGSTLRYVTDVFARLDTNPGVIGVALAGYLLALGLKRVWLPPVAGAVVFGIAAAAVAGQVHVGELAVGSPQVVPVLPAFDPSTLLTISLPLVLVVVATGNVQGMGVLAGQGYVPPVTPTTYVVGASTIVNGLFGAHAATVQSVGTGILAGEDAGPREQRYVATVIAGIGCIVLAFTATVAGTLIGVLPVGLVATFAGLAVLRTLLDTTQKALSTELKTGAFVALAIAASPLSLFGIGSAFWALAGGYAVSLVVERAALRESARCLPCEAAAAAGR
jgi:benzoate membrane transport protein